MKKRIVIFLDIDTDQKGGSAKSKFPDSYAEENFGTNEAYMIRVRDDIVRSKINGPVEDIVFAVSAHEISHALDEAFRFPEAMADLRNDDSVSFFHLENPAILRLKAETKAWDHAQVIFDAAREFGLSSYKKHVPQEAR